MPVESSSPLVVSNRKEVLRCFTVLGKPAAHAGPSADANVYSRGGRWTAHVQGVVAALGVGWR